ncbi:MAG: hypothetical protein NC483_00265 [Ruminococcus sp.]|nr:hypothetical protein [Ruminococcus sp.]
MKIEKLRKNNSKKHFLYGLIMVVVLTITITFITSKANYRMTASIPLTEGKVVSSSYDINVMAMYINDGSGYVELAKTNTIPTGYTINKENTYCCKGSNCKKENKDTNAILETIGGIHTFRGISKGDKCFIYLDKDISTAKTMSELLATHYIGRYTRTSKNKDFNISFNETTIGVIYEGEDDNGTTYYFAGNPLDNWIEFGGYYWRIIRVNGDGSIRIIYQGRTQDENGNKLEPQTTGEETQIGKSAFNEKDNDNAYVGFMYGTPNSTTYEATHENKNSSTIKQELDKWFNNSNIKEGTDYFNKIDFNAGFCSDKTPSSTYTSTIIDGVNIGNGYSGIGTSKTYYASHIKMIPNTPGGNAPTINSTSVTPTFSCSNINNDLFTYKKATNGNKKLDNPVGLITADEISYAGMVYALNSNKNYLDTDQNYWAISPGYYEADKARTFCVLLDGYLWYTYTSNSLGIRPVINLRSDTLFTGDGTISNPFKVVI